MCGVLPQPTIQLFVQTATKSQQTVASSVTGVSRKDRMRIKIGDSAVLLRVIR
jgi:hypothetical protein